MRIQSKTFYADLFSNSPSPTPAPAGDTNPRPAALLKSKAITPMAPLAPALSSKARSRLDPMLDQFVSTDQSGGVQLFAWK